VRDRRRETLRESVKVAARWWADQLRGKVEQDNGDALQSAFATRAAGLIRPLDPLQIDLFEVDLAQKLDAALDEEERRRRYGEPHLVFGTDYGPDPMMAEVCEELEIRQTMLRFPFKTVMWLYPECVKVACGYRAPIETIYGSEVRA
jgi:hypothetical protein